MSKDVIANFEKCIHGKLKLTRSGQCWSVKEGQTDVFFRVSNNKSFGFRLEKQSHLPFFTDSPPKDVAKMCDAIITMSYNNKDYIFVIELKSAYKEDYIKQLKNGRFFCDWLLALLKEYGHFGRAAHYIGILCYEPREKTPEKGETSHKNRPMTLSRTQPFPTVKIANKEQILLSDCILECEQKDGD